MQSFREKVTVTETRVVASSWHEVNRLEIHVEVNASGIGSGVNVRGDGRVGENSQALA